MTGPDGLTCTGAGNSFGSRRVGQPTSATPRCSHGPGGVSRCRARITLWDSSSLSVSDGTKTGQCSKGKNKKQRPRRGQSLLVMLTDPSVHPSMRQSAQQDFLWSRGTPSPLPLPQHWCWAFGSGTAGPRGGGRGDASAGDGQRARGESHEAHGGMTSTDLS